MEVAVAAEEVGAEEPRYPDRVVVAAGGAVTRDQEEVPEISVRKAAAAVRDRP